MARVYSCLVRSQCSARVRTSARYHGYGAYFTFGRSYVGLCRNRSTSWSVYRGARGVRPTRHGDSLVRAAYVLLDMATR